MRKRRENSSTDLQQLTPHKRIADYGFMVAFFILLIIAATMTDVFFTQRNLSNLFRQIVTNGLLSFGMLIVILSGGMGGRAIEFFSQLGVEAATGASGTVRQALGNYLGGALKEAAPCDESVAHGHG